jgi:hypothetical protein
MPRARSRLTEPLEKESISRSMASSVILKMAPLPNCFSMVETARAIALSLCPSALPLPPLAALPAMSILLLDSSL